MYKHRGHKPSLRRRRLIRLAKVALAILVCSLLILGFDSSRRKVEAPESKEVVEKIEESENNTNDLPALNITDPTSQYVLVNKQHSLNPSEYKPNDLVKANIKTSSSDSLEEQSIRTVIQTDTEAMFSAASAAGFDLTMNSGFRSYKAQSFYFNNYVKQSGLEAAKKFSAEPGHSEHQTGLAFDISYTNRKCYLEICFGQTEAGRWLATNAHQYGFILRYLEGKEDITGYQYEPWHFRYLGKDVAKQIFEQSITYEEYLKNLGLI